MFAFGRRAGDLEQGDVCYTDRAIQVILGDLQVAAGEVGVGSARFPVDRVVLLEQLGGRVKLSDAEQKHRGEVTHIGDRGGCMRAVCDVCEAQETE